jgi:N4-gp56 family major capsid protein
MAGGATRTTDIDDAFVPLVVESRYTEEHATTMAGLVRREDLEDGRGDSVKIPKYNKFDDAVDTAEGVDITQSQRLLDTLTTITPTEIGIKVVVTKRTVDTRRDDIMKIVGKLAGDSMGRKEEKMALVMLDGFSNALGSAGTALTWEHIGAAKVAIRGGGGGAAALVEPAPMASAIVGVFHPHQLWPLAKDFSPAGTYPVPSGISEEIMRKGKIGRIADVPLFEAGLLTIDSSDDAKGGVFCKDAIIGVLGEREEYQDFRGSLRAYEMTMVRWLTFAEWNDGWGREMLFDSVMPVS